MAEISPTKSIDLTSISIPPRTTLGARMAALDVGQGFEIKGIERAYIYAASARLREEGRRISTKRLGTEHYLVFRTA